MRFGFTLTELLVVVAILAILALALFPLSRGTLQGAREKGTAEKVASLLEKLPALARARGEKLTLLGVRTQGGLELRVRAERSGEYLPPPFALSISGVFNPQAPGTVLVVEPSGLVSTSNPIRVGRFLIQASRWGEVCVDPPLKGRACANMQVR